VTFLRRRHYEYETDLDISTHLHHGLLFGEDDECRAVPWQRGPAIRTSSRARVWQGTDQNQACVVRDLRKGVYRPSIRNPKGKIERDKETKTDIAGTVCSSKRPLTDLPASFVFSRELLLANTPLVTSTNSSAARRSAQPHHIPSPARRSP
jgi:hypothetical protein